MQIHIYKDAETIGKAAAALFAAQIIANPNTVLGLATGSTPIPTYKELIRMYEEGILDFSTVRSWNLDEYVGLNPDHPCSYRRFMNEELFDHVNIDKNNTHVPNGVTPNPEEYEAEIRALGGVDIQLLGIGSDAHIAFNEPNDHFVYPTNVIELTEMTRSDNARFFNSIDEVPTHAISMGIGSIMSAKRIVLIATGKGKAEAVKNFINGPVDPRVPASILQMHHDCVIMLDEDAASML